MSKPRHRLWEAGKSLLILLLTLSALALARQVFQNSGTAPMELLSGTPGPSPSALELLGRVGVARPVRMAVTNANGRYGVQYDDGGVDALFDALGGLLGEALGSAQTPVRTTRLAWEEALHQRGIYYEFPGAVPLSLAAAWLSGGESSLSLTAEASRLLLAESESGDSVRLYYVDAADGSYYTCQTVVLFLDLPDNYAPNGAMFAFEQPERYGGLAPDTLILSSPPAPPIYQAGDSLNLGEDALRDALLQSLEFFPQSNAVYPTADAWSVRDGGDTLRLTSSGTVVYHAGGNEPRYPIPQNASRAELVERTGQLVWNAVAPHCGAARVYLSGITQSRDTYTLTYSYTLSGAEVQLGREGWCARFTIRNGQITEYTLRLRRYSLSGESTVLLPEYQAMAAMQAMQADGRLLFLCYYDGGSGRVAPSWIAR